MKTKQDGQRLTIYLEGQIGEGTPMFSWKLPTTNELILDMSKATSINSAGVKGWIVWTLRIPKNCHVKILNAPFVIASQASMVLGFLAPNMTIESLRVPFVCDSCGLEDIRCVKRGVEYEYSAGKKSKWVRIELRSVCPKCGKNALEPDFMLDKTFQFVK